MINPKARDKRVLQVGFSPAQCRMARAALQWSQDRLATTAEVSKPVVVDFERGARVPMTQNLRAMRRALEEAGVAFDGIRSVTCPEDPDAVDEEDAAE